jgi:hypothetical protein
MCAGGRADDSPPAARGFRDAYQVHRCSRYSTDPAMRRPRVSHKSKENPPVTTTHIAATPQNTPVGCRAASRVTATLNSGTSLVSSPAPAVRRGSARSNAGRV